MRASLKKYLPRRVFTILHGLRAEWRMLNEFVTDWWRYRRQCSPDDSIVRDTSIRLRNAETQLTKDYHRVEKGLALANPKRPFGAEVRRRLTSVIAGVDPQDRDATYVRYAEEAVDALDEWNEFGTVSESLAPRTFRVARREEQTFGAVVSSRRSVRDFAPEEVDPALIHQALEMASTTPSVCNRQPWRAHVAQDGDMVQQILSHQNGNRGFRESVPCVLVITVDVRLFTGADERNQPFIEGGLFAMNLTLALHSLGLDTCLLNMSRRNREIDPLRSVLDLSPHDRVVMMMAVGHGRPDHRVARSPRRKVDDIVRWHSGEGPRD